MIEIDGDRVIQIMIYRDRERDLARYRQSQMDSGRDGERDKDREKDSVRDRKGQRGMEGYGYNRGIAID